MIRIDEQDKNSVILPLFKSSRGFKMLVISLGSLVAIAVLAYLRQLWLGLGVTNMDRPIYWGTYMVNFVFFIGISHAGTLISAILRVTGAEWRRPITRIAEAITVFALIVGTLQIIIDMGRPDRIVFTILHGRLQSPILWDIISVTLYLLSSITYLYLPLIPDVAILRDYAPDYAPLWQRTLYTWLSLGWRGNREQWMRLEKAIAVMAVLIIPVAVSVHSIISWILATTVQPGWHSSIFGPYFVVGAIFSGIGALFVAMTAVRKALRLENYIGERQYRNLGYLFITMNIIWFYFTFAENLALATGQQPDEFIVLASKLWGDYHVAFWIMVGMMAVALWILVVPKLLPEFVLRLPVFKPRLAYASTATAGILFILMQVSSRVPNFAMLSTPNTSTIAWAVIVGLLVLAALSVSYWFKERAVATTVIAGVLVLIGMWLERWNIIVPTLTHPRLVQYSSYFPSLTEFMITIGSMALFMLMFVVFFRFFPSVSIWEVMEGRALEQAKHALANTSSEASRSPS